MNKINWNRVILGGLLGGIVLSLSNVLKEIAVPEFGLKWAAALERLGIDIHQMMVEKMMLVYFFIHSVCFTLFAVWLYAALEVYYGAKLKTSVYAGFFIWFVGYLLPMVGYMMFGMFSPYLVILSAGLSLPQFIFATIAGAYIYNRASLDNSVKVK